MALTYGFYNSIGGDRKYDANQMSAFFDGIITNGIIPGYGNKMDVNSTGGLNIGIGTGRAWFNNRWTLNDSVYTLTLPPAHATLHRNDEIVLEINEPVRANTFRVIPGPTHNTSNPPRAFLSTSNGVYHYALATVYRPPNTASVTNANIMKRIGGETPYATLASFKNVDTISAHKTAYRGAYLGNGVTVNQINAVRDGSFKDIWLGDYWTISGYNWRIVDIDYYLGAGGLTNHHLVVMPDTHMGVYQMHTSRNNDGGYFAASIRTIFPTIFGPISANFGSYRLTFSEWFTNSVSGGVPLDSTTYAVSMEFPSESQVFGQRVIGAFNPATPAGRKTNGYAQFELFRQCREFISAQAGGSWWTRDTAPNGMYVSVGSSGAPDLQYADLGLGARPYFLIG